MTKIPWTDESWNPVVGCSKCSPGCLNCYAERMAVRLAHIQKTTEKYSKVIGDDMRGNYFWNGKILCDVKALNIPLHWRKPRRIFVCSMGDLFHPKVPFEFVDKIFVTMIQCPQHTFQVLTKRIKRATKYFPNSSSWVGWPKHFHFGVSISTQAEADKKIPILLQIPTAVRFVSIEPLLEDMGIIACLFGEGLRNENNSDSWKPLIDWVIIGAESINGRAGRECKIEWVRDVVQQCKAAGVPCFVKQIHIFPGDLRNGNLSKNMAEWPKDLRVQEYPK